MGVMPDKPVVINGIRETPLFPAPNNHQQQPAIAAEIFILACSGES